MSSTEPDIHRVPQRGGPAASAITAILVLTGCATGGGDIHEHNLRPGVVPAADEFSVETAERICSIDSLTQARDEWRTEIRETAFDSRPAFGPDTAEEEEIRVEAREHVRQRPFGPQTESVELVRAFETDLDAAYRFASSSCRAYAVCMHQRGYDEESCNRSRIQWSEAREDFYRLSDRLAQVRLDISETCTECGVYEPAPHYGGHPRDPHYRGHPPRRHHSSHDDCESVLGDVFTTSACEQRGHSRYRGGYERP